MKFAHLLKLVAPKLIFMGHFQSSTEQQKLLSLLTCPFPAEVERGAILPSNVSFHNVNKAPSASTVVLSVDYFTVLKAPKHGAAVLCGAGKHRKLKSI